MEKNLWFKFHRLPLFIVLVITALDQLSKVIIANTITYQKGVIQIIPNFFDLVYITNRGAAWGIFNQYTWLLTLISFVASVLMIVFFKKLHENLILNSIAVSLIIGGTIGNFLDRFLLGEVVDFLSFHYKEHYFPAFNVADSAICVGVFLMIVAPIIYRKKKKND